MELGLPTAAGLQIVYVNYFSCDHLVRSIDSLITNTAQTLPIEIVVIDNSCDQGEAARLAAELPDQVLVIHAASNLGFARGCNLGARHSQNGHAPSKHILFLNPDTIVPAGTMQRLVDELDRRDGRALIGPRHYADAEQQFAHAPFRGARLLDEAWDLLFAHGWDRRRPLRYMRDRARIAEARGPVRQRALSGGCLAVGRATFDALGGWDEAYWMYGEDLELCVRARRRGIEVLYFPDIPIIHFMEASSRLIPERIAESQERGRALFKQARYGRAGSGLDKWLTLSLSKRLPRREDPWLGATELRDHTLTAPRQCKRWAVELARSPLFDNCLTAFPEHRTMQVPESLIDWLPPATYYLRITGEVARKRWWQSSLHRLTTEGKQRSEP